MTDLLGKRDIPEMDVSDIMTHVWKNVGPNEGISLTDKFTVDALVELTNHRDWTAFPPYFRDWVIDVVDHILNEE